MSAPQTSAATGTPGLEGVVGGPAWGRPSVLDGSPDDGRATVTPGWLMAGDRPLRITLSGTEAVLPASAASHGWAPDGVHIRGRADTHAPVIETGEARILRHFGADERVRRAILVIGKPTGALRISLGEPQARVQDVPMLAGEGAPPDAPDAAALDGTEA